MAVPFVMAHDLVVSRTLPTGTVTFLFTDVEGSTRLLRQLGAERYAHELAEHRRILRETFSAHGGAEVDTQGDAFFVAFTTASGAAQAAAWAVKELSSGPIQVRIGIHTGTAHLDKEGYVGVDVHRAARIAAAAHGGQVLVSASTAALLGSNELRDLGEHRLKDLTQPERLYQLMTPGIETEFPALKTLENRPTNLPTQPTPLLGRQQELAHTVDLLHRDEIRVLTLTGAGGTGKTRLALQLASDLLKEFPDGVFFVDLAALRDPSLVVATVAQTLAVREVPGQSLEETLAEHLRGRRLLLLLDNFEQLLAGAKSLGVLLAAAPRLKLLVTSRAPLRLAAEHEYAVQPLELPDPERLPEVAELSRYEAVALFVERARAVRAGFKVTNQNAPALAEICARLDGLPLAIELAAARIRALTPQALLGRLEQQLELLTGGPRDAPARQQTMRGAIDWSYALLSGPQQRLFLRLSVFVGGCDLEAVEAVCDFDDRLGLDVFEGISALIENNLLAKQDDPRAQPRYAMLETIREYASWKVEASGETDALRRRHSEYFSALAERGERTMHYIAPVGRVERAMTAEAAALAETPEERAQRELPNLRAALQWTFDKGELELALRLAVAASWGWALSSAYTEGRRWITRVLDATEHLQTLERARALFWLAEFAAWQGDFRSAETFNERARALFERHHDQVGVFRSLLGLTEFEVNLGDLERARIALERAGALVDGLASEHERAQLCFKGAQVEALSGDYEQANALVEEGLRLCRKLGVPRRQWVNELINIGWFALLQHDFTRARAALKEYLAEDSGKTPRGIARAHANLGLITLHEGNPEDAALRFREALALAREAGTKRTIATAAYGLAAVAAIDDDVERSVRLWDAADAIRQSTNSQLSTQEHFIIERHLESAKATLAGDVHYTARADGGPTTLDEALAYALEQLNSAPGS
jgi:predicted ATPase/class 3 adenylate cyclase